MFRIFTCLLLAGFGVLPAATVDAQEKGAIAWIDSLGGHYSRNEAGQITGVDLRNRWVTDADLDTLRRDALQAEAGTTREVSLADTRYFVTGRPIRSESRRPSSGWRL